MSTSLVYRSAVGYELLMRALYGRYYTDRMRAVAGEVPDGSSVLELCCGPGTLYLRYLRARTRRYVGIDVNARFVAQLQRRGVDARRLDLAAGADPLPDADAVILQASLYHFLPDPEANHRPDAGGGARPRDRVRARSQPRLERPAADRPRSAGVPPTRASAGTLSGSLRRRSMP